MSLINIWQPVAVFLMVFCGGAGIALLICSIVAALSESGHRAVVDFIIGDRVFFS